MKRYAPQSIRDKAAQHGVDVSLIDTRAPLEQQGPFDAILHKLPPSHPFHRHLASLRRAQHDPAAAAAHSSFAPPTTEPHHDADAARSGPPQSADAAQASAPRHPILLDAPEDIAQVQSRHSMLDALWGGLHLTPLGAQRAPRASCDGDTAIDDGTHSARKMAQLALSEGLPDTPQDLGTGANAAPAQRAGLHEQQAQQLWRLAAETAAKQENGEHADDQGVTGKGAAAPQIAAAAQHNDSEPSQPHSGKDAARAQAPAPRNGLISRTGSSSAHLLQPPPFPSAAALPHDAARICVPRSCVVRAGMTHAEAEAAVKRAGLRFPLLCKPLKAEGSAGSHGLALLLSLKAIEVRLAC